MKKILFLLLSLTVFAQCIRVTASELIIDPLNTPPVIEGYQSEEELINSPDFENYQSRESFLDELPTFLHSCIPTNAVKFRLWSILEKSANSYYLIGLLSKSGQFDIVIQTNGASCSALTPLEKPLEAFSLLSYVDEEILLPMVKVQLESIATELGGIDVLKQQFFDYYSVMDIYHHVPLEELLVSEQLGIYYTDDFTGIIVVTPNGNYPLAEFRKMQ